MSIRTIARRVLLCREALAGRLDNVHLLAIKLEETEERAENTRRVMLQIHEERQYWYNLWFTMGREFENGQNALIEEIGNLRQRVGHTGDKWEELVKKSFHARHVEPAVHPVPGVRTDLKHVPSPPQPPPET